MFRSCLQFYQVLLEQFKRIVRRSLFVQTAEPADLFSWTCHEEFVPKKIATKKISSKYLQAQMEMEGLMPSTELLAHFADRVSISQSAHAIGDDDDDVVAPSASASAATRGRSESKVAALAKRVKNGGEAVLPSRLKAVNAISPEAATAAAVAAAAAAPASTASAASAVAEQAAVAVEKKPRLELAPGADRFLAPLPSSRVVNSATPRNLAGRRASLVPEDQCSSAVAPADAWTALPSQRPWMQGATYPNPTGRRRVWA